MFEVNVLKFYIAVQDGRYNDKEYDTQKQAEDARLQISEPERNSTCIMSYKIPLKITEVAVPVRVEDLEI